MIAGILSALTVLKPFLIPFMTFLAGWLFPSPLKKAEQVQGDVHAAEKKADDTGGNVDDLDRLP